MSKENEAPNRFRKSSFALPTLFVLALTLGVGAGYFLNKFLKPTVVSVEGDASRYQADMDAILKHYESVKSSGANYAVSLEPYEIINVGYHLFSSHEYNFSQGVGSSKAMGLVDQGIQSTAMRNLDEYFEESNSFSSFVALFNRMYQSGDNTTKYWGSNSNYADHSPEVITSEQYALEMGRKISEPTCYIVSKKTESKQDLSGRGLSKVEKLPNGDILVDFEGDPQKMTLNYVKQMKTISNLKAYPSFDYCHLTVKLDKDLNIKWARNFEAYTATLSSGLGSRCEGSMTTGYLVDTKDTHKIPAVHEDHAPYPSSESELLAQFDI